MPDSFSVGTSGAVGERAEPVVAIARSLPCLICEITETMLLNMKSTSPLITATAACAELL